MFKLCATALAVAFCVATPAVADSTCVQTPKEMRAAAAKGHATINSDFKIKGDDADRLIVASDPDEVWMFVFQKNCLQTIIPLDSIGAPPTSAPAKPAAPVAPSVSL